MKPQPAGRTLRADMAAALAAALIASGCESPEIESPIPRFADTPVRYPAHLWQEGIEGTTLVRVLVNEAGIVDSAMVAETSGNRTMDSAAVQGVRDMAFEPALRLGEPVKVWARVPVEFSKEETGATRSPPDPATPDTAGSGDRSSSRGRHP